MIWTEFDLISEVILCTENNFLFVCFAVLHIIQIINQRKTLFRSVCKYYCFLVCEYFCAYQFNTDILIFLMNCLLQIVSY